MSICIVVMPSLGARDLEVHVAEVILVAEDVGEDGEVLAFEDQAHRDAAKPGASIGTPASIMRERTAAHRRHRATSRWTR